MSRRVRILLVVLLLAVIAAAGYYLYSHLTPYTETVQHGPSPEAKANPYLAAEHYLRERGVTVHGTRNLVDVLDHLPSKGNTLILLGTRGDVTPLQTERLLDWANQGGHLIVTAERLWDEDEGKSGDLLLDRLGVQQYLTDDMDEADDEAKDKDQDKSAGKAANKRPAAAPTPPADTAADAHAPAKAQGDEDEEEDDYPQLTKLYLDNDQAPAYIDFDTDYHLYDSKNLAYAWANSHDATHLLQLQHGKGLITVLTDNWIWQPPRIDKHDNAWLLWYLTQDSAVTLLYRADSASLASLLARHYPEALAAFGLLLALLLWRASLRQGPLLPVASRARRQLLEHLRASADFILRQRGHVALLQGLQRDVLRRARQRQPGFERLPVAEQWQALGRMTRLPVSAISQAMRPYPVQRIGAAEFTRQVAHLQTLRNAL
ncbi:MAG: hypothetical protein GAK43_01438 [Stenotrophomonas maltophilia]|nr:MAG: hypothetical protein GAK43_01438 [Stenotrophomonas maltophilia]